MNRRICAATAAAVFIFISALAGAQLPDVEREFRAVWVATVANIDWPSKPGLSTEEQKAEAIAILDKVRQLNMNAVVFQVRAQADSFYASALEPWSYYLTGEQGKAPEPYYDPLEFWVEEAHARGIELHAWFNPYRAAHPSMRGELAQSSIVNTSPELVRPLGDNGYYWMVPTKLEVQKHSFDVVMDVVERYDVDGIHFDDYFYPYESYNDGKIFQMILNGGSTKPMGAFSAGATGAGMPLILSSGRSMSAPRRESPM
jgi:uncharacterized lipoprotein YddW (UPF0748 family)